MPLQRSRFPWPLIILVFVGLAVLFFVGRYRLVIDTDIITSLPQDDPVVADGRYVIKHHPMQDRVVIDLGIRSSKTSLLFIGAELVEKSLLESGFFKNVGFSQYQQLFPELISYVTDNLPILLSDQDLKEKVEPLLTPENIQRTLSQAYSNLTGLEGIGQVSFLTRDPLELRMIVLRRLSMFGSSQKGSLVKGQLLSADHKHLLIIAEPVISGYDTAFSQKITTLLEEIGRKLNRRFTGDDSFTLNPVGAYRAALDNESAAKADTHRAVLISTGVIALLLLLGFPRPWIGLLALVPAFGGTIAALCVYSLFQRSISVLAMGFGGAVISFTVDYGIAYLLFLDRPQETDGFEVTKEVWSLGLLAMLTTAVSFAFLFIAGFPALSQLGFFAALGVVFTYIFVHAIYPFLFPVVKPAKRKGVLPLQQIADRLARGGMKAVFCAVLFGAVMCFFARLDFRVDLQSLNTVSPQTRAAEKLVQDVWGNVINRVFLAVEGKTLDELRGKEDRLANFLETEMTKGTVESVFVPSMLFPGDQRAKQNFEAWQAFWTRERLTRLRQELDTFSHQTGFTRGAFAPFWAAIETRDFQVPEIPKAFFLLLNIEKKPGRDWTHYAVIQPGRAYQGTAFYDSLVAKDLARVFDPVLFSNRLGQIILNGFSRVIWIVGVMTFLVSLLYLGHWRLTFIALIPTFFSLVSTLGILRLLGQPLGIPVIMVAAVVVGMGTDYALYLVRAYQRYGDENHPSVGLIRLTVFLSFATTSIGFWVLALSGHALLKSAGMALALGIGFSYLGTMAFVPPLIKKILEPIEWKYIPVVPGSKQHYRQVFRRYRNVESWPRLMVRYKLWFDSLFPELGDLVQNPRFILDIGSGYGIPAVYLLEIYPEARVMGLEPNPKRALLASLAVGDRGKIIAGQAPALPEIPEKADTVLLLDVLPFLNDEKLEATLRRLKEVLSPGGRLIIRTKIPFRAFSFWRTFHPPAYFRSGVDIEKKLKDGGFGVIHRGPSAGRQSKQWIIAQE